MILPININNSWTIIELSVVIYKVNVHRGWGVTVGDFSFTLTNLANQRTIKPEGTIWRVQYYSNNKRSKKIFSLDIPERGKYRSEFQNL